MDLMGVMQMKWTKTLLNGGVEPMENATIIPPAAFDEITTAQILIEGKSSQPNFSISGYGMGWVRGSYQGYEVGLGRCFSIVSVILTF